MIIFPDLTVCNGEEEITSSDLTLSPALGHQLAGASTVSLTNFQQSGQQIQEGVAMSTMSAGVDIDNLQAQLLRARASNTALKDVLKPHGAEFIEGLNFDYGLQPDQPPAAPKGQQLQAPDASHSAPAPAPAPVPAPVPTHPSPAHRGTMQVDASTIDQLKATVESLLRDLNRSLKEKDDLEAHLNGTINNLLLDLDQMLRDRDRLAAEKEAMAKDFERTQKNMTDAYQADLADLVDSGKELHQQIVKLKEEKEAAKEKMKLQKEKQEEELTKLRNDLVEAVNSGEQSKTQAVQDIESSYMEALRAAQAKTQEIRNGEKKAHSKLSELQSTLEALKAELRKAEAERAAVQTSLEEERKDFSRFREDAKRSIDELKDQVEVLEGKEKEADIKRQNAEMLYQEEKRESERQQEKLRSELHALADAHERSNAECSKAYKEVEHVSDQSRDAKKHAMQLVEAVRTLKQDLARAEETIRTQNAELARIDLERQNELKDMEEVRRALAARDQELRERHDRATHQLILTDGPNPPQAPDAQDPAPLRRVSGSPDQAPRRSAAPPPPPPSVSSLEPQAREPERAAPPPSAPPVADAGVVGGGLQEAMEYGAVMESQFGPMEGAAGEAGGLQAEQRLEPPLSSDARDAAEDEVVGVTITLRDEPWVVDKGWDALMLWLRDKLADSLQCPVERIVGCWAKRQPVEDADDGRQTEVVVEFNILPDVRGLDAPDELAAELVLQAGEPASLMMRDDNFRHALIHIGLHSGNQSSEPESGADSWPDYVKEVVTRPSFLVEHRSPNGSGVQDEREASGDRSTAPSDPPPARSSGVVDEWADDLYGDGRVHTLLPTYPVDAVVEVFVVSARNLPLPVDGGDEGRWVRVVAAFGGQGASTGLAELGGPMLWQTSFRFGIDNPADTALIFNVMCVDGTVRGKVAVPVQRLVAKQKEQGWYDLRDPSGHELCGPEGRSAIQLGFSVLPSPPDMSRSVGRLGAEGSSGSVGSERLVVVDPYGQTLSQFPTSTLKERLGAAPAANALQLRGSSVTVDPYDVAPRPPPDAGLAASVGPCVLAISVGSEMEMRLRARDFHTAQDWMYVIRDVAALRFG